MRFFSSVQLSLLLCMPVFLLCACAFFHAEEKPAADPLCEKKYAQAQRLVSRARRLWKDDLCLHPKKAITWLNQALALNPDSAEALRLRGLAKSDLGNQDAAFDDLSKAVRLHPDAEVYTDRAVILIRSGNIAGALQDVDEAIRQDTEQARAWNLRGAIFYEAGKEDEACTAFQHACDAGDCTGLDAAREEAFCR